ncbi:ParD-like family protein (plasmid) [Mesorhizobium sp. AR07]|uniref:ParD-like family protein n=1 Tax=Mesorhizobium huakuii TaxID=28104 RepID=A0A7G6T5N0_9HYPH|nr:MULTISPECIES: hypothetical protein [Mesorhizobium]QND62062.1 hypothetical protein HB778_38880 [Mesorhizobium huakuii]QND69455.1 hypothetical protein HB777_37995 [Mesorhizobium loti]UVK48061.1 ParD-like family protein [Mesorhizobium sp. AR07]
MPTKTKPSPNSPARQPKIDFASVKLSSALVNLAREDAPVFSRSIGGQLEHWARIGRAIEQAPGFTLDRVRAALEGRFDPALLADQERTHYYDLLDDVMLAPSSEETAAMALLGRSAGAAGYDAHGRLVRVAGDGNTVVIEE